MRTIRLLPTVIPVLWMVGLRCAASGAAEAESPEAEVVPEGGEIDSRAVAAGARVMVVHGRGERHPVSREWTRLDTSAGYVQAVDGSTLVLAREGDLRQERISLDRIQRRSLVAPAKTKRRPSLLRSLARREIADSEGRVVPGSTSVEVERREERSVRIFRKLGAGAFGGVVWGLAGSILGAAVFASDGGCEGDLCGLGIVAGIYLGGVIGYPVGAAVGVSRLDPHDRFISAMAGSAAGLIPGIYLTRAEGILWPTLFAAPIVTATMMSEWSRDPPEDAGISLRLSPTPGRGISAVAALRF